MHGLAQVLFVHVVLFALRMHSLPTASIFLLRTQLLYVRLQRRM